MKLPSKMSCKQLPCYALWSCGCVVVNTQKTVIRYTCVGERCHSVMRCCLVWCQATLGWVNVLPEDKGSTFLRNGGEFLLEFTLDCVSNVIAHAQKTDFVFRRNGRRVHLNRRVRQFSRLLAAELCASAVVMLDTPCSEVV